MNVHMGKVTGTELEPVTKILVLVHACPSPRSLSCPSYRSCCPDRWPPLSPSTQRWYQSERLPLKSIRQERSASSAGPQVVLARVEDDHDIDGSDAVERVAGSRGDETRDTRVLRPFSSKYVSTVQSRSPYHHSTIHRTYSRTYIQRTVQ